MSSNIIRGSKRNENGDHKRINGSSTNRLFQLDGNVPLFTQSSLSPMSYDIQPMSTTRIGGEQGRLTVSRAVKIKKQMNMRQGNQTQEI